MIDLSDIKIEVVENDGKVGIFKIGPMPKGFGNTLANPFRRILLSSLQGGAVTSIRMKGVEHEYSTITGVKETVVEIQLNLKNIRFKCDSDEPQVIKLLKKGKGIVTAGDFELTESVQVMNKDAKLATITDDSAELEMEVVVERGVGFRTADEELRSEVGRLPMHADFSPVERVVFSIEKTRKGEQMDLDLVELSIFTDGSIDPLEALGRSAEILKVAFEKMIILAGVIEEPAAVEAEEGSGEVSDQEVREMLIEDIPNSALKSRSKNSLIGEGFTTVDDVLKKSSKELLEVPGFGETALKGLIGFLGEYGLSLEE